MNDNYKADEASSRSEQLDAAEKAIRNRLAEIGQEPVSKLIDQYSGYTKSLEDYLLNLEENGFERCECCKHVVHKDVIKNLQDSFNNYLDIFVCEDCAEEI
jgi:superfamily II helicase